MIYYISNCIICLSTFQYRCVICYRINPQQTNKLNIQTQNTATVIALKPEPKPEQGIRRSWLFNVHKRKRSFCALIRRACGLMWRRLQGDSIRKCREKPINTGWYKIVCLSSTGKLELKPPSSWRLSTVCELIQTS